MFPNTDRSNKETSTNIYYNNLNNICWSNAGLNTDNNLKDLIEGHAEIVIVTKHLCIPCPRLYTDIFKSILIVCNHFSHKRDRYAEDNELDDKIQNLIERRKSNGLL